MTLVVFVLAVCQLTFQIHAHPNGAPKKVCVGSMLPHHHHLPPQPPATSPMTKFYAQWNPDNETVSIQMEFNQPIKGIFVQGRLIDGDEPLGTFIDIPSTTHLVKCETGDGLTHSFPQKWKELQLTWKKPMSMTNQDKIQFWTTMVVDFENFWVVQSAPVELNAQKPAIVLIDLINDIKKKVFQVVKWTYTKIFQYN